MPYNYDVDRPIKAFVRKQLWTSVKGVAKKVLLLPGRDCLDIKEGIDAGKIDPETTVLHLFEEYSDIARIIRKNCKKLGLKHATVFDMQVQHLHWGETALYSFFHTKTGRLAKGRSNYDLVFLDFCGQITQEILDFIKFIAIPNRINLMSDDGVLAFTFAYGLRREEFFKSQAHVRMNKTFIPPAGSLRPWSSQAQKKAVWTAQIALKSIKKGYKDLIDFYAYNDTKTPMLFFSVDFSGKQVQKKERKKHESNNYLPGARQAWVTRRTKKLQAEYKVATGPGDKSWIKREINSVMTDAIIAYWDAEGFTLEQRKKEMKKVKAA